MCPDPHITRSVGTGRSSRLGQGARSTVYHVDMERRPIHDGERIAARIQRRGDCWIWQGSSAADGYPVFASTSRTVSIIPTLWVQEYGAVPDGMVLTCTHPRAGSDVCVNPTHYRPRPKGKVLAKVCKWGHDLTDPANIWINGGRRYCLPCIIRRSRESRENPGSSSRRSTK